MAGAGLVDSASRSHYPQDLEVPFPPELEAELERAAADHMSDTPHYVQQLVERYLGHDLWFRQKVAASLDQLDRGEFLTQEQVAERLKKRKWSFAGRPPRLTILRVSLTTFGRTILKQRFGPLKPCLTGSDPS
jgi:predicted transcriptional regulator